jgi:hypothetical protein
MPTAAPKLTVTPGHKYHESPVALLIQGMHDEQIHIVALQECVITFPDRRVFKEAQVCLEAGEIHTLHWDPQYAGTTSYAITDAAGNVVQDTTRHEIPPIGT